MRYLMLLCLMMAPPINQTGTQPTIAPPETVYLLKPAHVFDGESSQLHDDWVVLVRGECIEAAGAASGIKAPGDAKIIDLPGMTLLPGLIEAHSHVLLHPYTQTAWTDPLPPKSFTLPPPLPTTHIRTP